MFKSTCMFIAVLLIAGSLTACSSGLLKKDSNETSKNQTLDESQPTSSIALTEEQSKTQGEKVVLTLYFTDKQVTKLVAEKRFIQKTELKDIGATAQASLKELFKGPISGSLASPFPKGVKLPAVKVEKDTAVVDISKEFVEKHAGGSAAENLSVYSIVNTLTAINGITQVEFTVDGKKAPEFKGHMDLSKPFKANPALITQDSEKKQ